MVFLTLSIRLGGISKLELEKLCTTIHSWIMVGGKIGRRKIIDLQ